MHRILGQEGQLHAWTYGFHKGAARGSTRVLEVLEAGGKLKSSGRLFDIQTDVVQKRVDQDRQPVFGGRGGLPRAKQPYKLGSSLYKTIWILVLSLSPFWYHKITPTFPVLPDGDYENLLVVIHVCDWRLADMISYLAPGFVVFLLPPGTERQDNGDCWTCAVLPLEDVVHHLPDSTLRPRSSLLADFYIRCSRTSYTIIKVKQ